MDPNDYIEIEREPFDVLAQIYHLNNNGVADEGEKPHSQYGVAAPDRLENIKGVQRRTNPIYKDNSKRRLKIADYVKN